MLAEDKAEKFDELLENLLKYKSMFKIEDGMLYMCLDRDGMVLHPLLRLEEKNVS